MTVNPILDLEELEVMTGGDVPLVRELIGLFQHQAQLWRPLLDPRGDPQTWADACHTIKGAARAMGARLLADACSDAEALRNRGDARPAEIAVRLNEVEDQLSTALDAVARLDYDLAVTGAFKRSKAANS
jgi:HPt (histidine-containing phosphotransfer) domain-containing protein